MKLAHPQLDTVFDFDCGKVNTIVIENPSFFRTFLRDIDSQLHGSSGSTVLSHNDMPVSFAGNAEIIESFLSFSVNRKPLITKLISRLESYAVNESNYIRTSNLIGELEQFILNLSFDLPCDIFCGKMNIGSILHAVGIEIPDDYENDLERLLDYMELTRELDRNRLFIIVNLRSFYSDDDVSLFLQSVLQHEYKVLLVDSFARNILCNESRITVDMDLCEF